MTNAIPFLALLFPGLVVASIGAVVYILWQQEGYESSGALRAVGIALIALGILAAIVGLIWMIVNFYKKSGLEVKTEAFEKTVVNYPVVNNACTTEAKVCAPCG